MISTRIIKAVLLLDEVSKSLRPITVLQLAVKLQVSSSLLETLASKLRKANYIRGERGPGGGYTLLKSLDDITLRDLWDVVKDEDSALSRHYPSSMIMNNAIVKFGNISVSGLLDVKSDIPERLVDSNNAAASNG